LDYKVQLFTGHYTTCLTQWRYFRKSPILVKQEPGELPPGDDEYTAFHAVDRDQKRLSARAVGLAWVHASDSFLQYVTEDAGRGRMFYIIFGFMVIEVRGRNLSPVVDAIRRDACAFIQQFDAAKWRKPKDTGIPVIESIAFHHGAELRGALLDGRPRQGTD
jgi:hypothetical protein